MMRWTFTALTALLLAVWLASGWGGVGWRFLSPLSGARHTVAVGLGTVHWARIEGVRMNLGLRTFGIRGYGEPELREYKLRLWFNWSGPPFGFISLPLWPFAPALAVPTLRLWHHRVSKKRLAQAAGCIHCGYDLTGLRPDDNTTPTCPECGEPAPPPR